MRIAAALVLTCATLACGKFGDDSNPNAPTSPLTPAIPVVYTAVGASDALGVGSSVPCFPFAECPNGMGYPQILTRRLKTSGFTASFFNLGLPTAVIGPDFEALGQRYNRTILGNFLDKEVPFIQGTSTLVTVFAGGNEVNTITAALGSGAGGSDPAGFIDGQVAAFASDFSTLVDGVRNRADGARIVALNVPNFAGVPYLAGASLPQRQAAQRAAVGMSRAVNALTSRNVVVVDLQCDPRTYLATTYSSDGFHPSDAGYTFIAGELFLAATTSTYPAPRSACSQMTAVPNP